MKHVRVDKGEHFPRAQHRHSTVCYRVDEGKVIRRCLEQGAAGSEEGYIRRHVQKVVVTVFAPGNVTARSAIGCTRKAKGEQGRPAECDSSAKKKASDTK